MSQHYRTLVWFTFAMVLLGSNLSTLLSHEQHGETPPVEDRSTRPTLNWNLTWGGFMEWEENSFAVQSLSGGIHFTSGEVNTILRDCKTEGPGSGFLPKVEVGPERSCTSNQFSVQFEGANPVMPLGRNVQDRYSNRIDGTGHSRANLKHYSELVYPGLWDGVDLVYRFDADHHLKYDLIVDTHADLNSIQFKFNGIESLRRTAEGGLVIDLGEAELREQVPVSWIEGADGQHQEVQVHYDPAGDRLGFAIDDPLLEGRLVIDPVLEWSTYLGGTEIAAEYPFLVTTDSLDRPIVTGFTGASDFPNTTGAYDQSFEGPFDVFVARFSADGTNLEWSSFIGGSETEWARGLALDSADRVIIQGFTNSTNFPITSGVHNGNYDVFVLRLAADGSALEWSTLLGGSGRETIGSDSLELDGSGRVVITGSTESSDFPTTGQAYDQGYNGGGDGFLARLSADGSTLEWSTFIGGGGAEGGWSLDLDSSDRPVLSGSTNSSDFPTTQGTYDETHNGGDFDIFVARFSANGSALEWSTFLGGSDRDSGAQVVIDSSDRPVLTGSTFSQDFPTTNGSYDLTHNGVSDLWVARLSANGSQLEWSTFLGGSGYDTIGGSFVLDPNNRPVITGTTGSADFPMFTGSYDQTWNGGNDVVLAWLSENGSNLLWSTYIGGSGHDSPLGSAVNASNMVVISGHTSSSDFPTTNTAYDQTYNDGQYDGFVLAIELKDSDGDHFLDSDDQCPSQAGSSWRDRAGCVDSDGDGQSDLNDPFPSDASQWADFDSDGWGDNASGVNPDACPLAWGNSWRDRFGCPDTDGDGQSDDNDAFPQDSSQWSDTDGDGYGDNASGNNPDAFPGDPTQWSDTDGDGYGDNQSGNSPDALPGDPTQWSDTDGDGYGDNQSGNDPDDYPTDPTQWRDTDGDGFGDNSSGTNPDALPNDPTQWNDTDGDGYGDNQFGNNPDEYPTDPTQWNDSDGDGYGDNPSGNNSDAFPDDPTQWNDTDSDGFGDNESGTNPDPFPADPTQWNDTDGDGYGDNPAGDNPDGCPLVTGTSWRGLLGCPDSDGDGQSDQEDPLPDDPSQWMDSDGDGWGDNSSGNDPDACPAENGTSWRDRLGCPDSDTDGQSDLYDPFPDDPTQWVDSDGDGYGDNRSGNDPDAFPAEPSQWSDTDGDGWGDNLSGYQADRFPNTPLLHSWAQVYGLILALALFLLAWPLFQAVFKEFLPRILPDMSERQTRSVALGVALILVLTPVGYFVGLIQAFAFLVVGSILLFVVLALFALLWHLSGGRGDDS